MLQVYKKILSTVILLIILPIMSTFQSYASGLGEGEQYFIVTAYYSPLPNQKYYNMGTYEAEKIMNGEGISGASGKNVYGGMVAAPSKYAFGTKIQLEGVGIASVEDRGGAIVAAGQRNFAYDRIDIWVGYGDEGLRRAMYWGKKTIKGKILPSATPSYININSLYAPKWVSVRTKKNPHYIDKTKNTTHPFFNYGIGTKSASKDITTLQKFLKDIAFYKGEVNGKYNTTLMQNIYNFQKENNLVSDWNDLQAGYWGFETRALIWKKFQNGDLSKIVAETNTQQVSTQKEVAVVDDNSQIQLTSQESIINEAIDVFQTAETTIKEKESIEEVTEAFIKNEEPKKDILSTTIQTASDIKLLQKELTELRLYDGEITGEYSDIRNSILEYQLDRGIIDSASDLGAGNYGPATRSALKNRKIKLSEKAEDKIEEKAVEEVSEEAKLEKQEEPKEQKEKPKQEKTQTAKRVEALKGVKFGDISHEVRELQIILKELGYFEDKDTAIFGEKTKAAILKYQLDKEVIKDKSVYGAGIFGPKTQAQMVVDLSNM